MDIQIKRVYEPSDADDGYRILVDRVWPRGMTKLKVGADLWMQDSAPSTVLRKWFDHDREKWEIFKKRYFLELDAKPEVLKKLYDKSLHQRLTLLYSARDIKCNQAVGLREYLLLHFKDMACQATATEK
jgi:uncharacterized protein YeaO (DUF488 family)